MKKFLFLIIILIYNKNLRAQNLVPNGDFERPNICNKYKEECTPLGWRATTLKLFGYHKEESAGHYVKLLLFDQSRDNDRKLAQTKLICPLEKGQKYRLSLKVKPNQFWINQFTIGFSTKLFLSNKVDLDQIKCSLVSLDIPKDIIEGHWFSFEKEFMATGKEQYLILGNLFPDHLTKVFPIDKKKFKRQKKDTNQK